MNSFLYRLRNALARFMYGRNGVDQLSLALLALYFVLNIASGFVPVSALRAVMQVFSTALGFLAVFRMFSRSLEKRRSENARFLRWLAPKRTFLRDWRYRRADKTHKYVKCGCGVWCRVPRGVGKVELKCPKCGEKKIIKT